MGRKIRSIWIWGIFFCVSLLLIHLSIRIYSGDEIAYFAHMMDGKSLWQFAKERYYEWSSRIIIEMILVYMANNYPVWKLCNVLLYVLWVYSLHKITKFDSGVILGLAMLYPIMDMISAGWIATTLNYFWPLVLGTYSFVAIDKVISGMRVKFYEVILSIVAEIIAINVEQYVVLHMLCLGIIMAYLLMKKDYVKNKFVIVIVHFVIAFANFLFIMTCPGNEERRLQEMHAHMQDFDNLSLLDKLIYGYNTTISGFLSQMCLLFLVFLLVIFACVVKKTAGDANRYWIISISVFPVVLAAIVSVGSIFRNGYFTEISNALSQGIIINPANWNKPINYIIFLLYVLFTISITFSIVYIFDDISVGSLHGILFLCSVLVRMVMGFSPTLYSSAQRTFCFSYGVVLYLLIALLKEMRLGFSGKEKKGTECLLFGISCIFVLEMITRICGRY